MIIIHLINQLLGNYLVEYRILPISFWLYMHNLSLTQFDKAIK
jgi:hypothetical protein